MRTQEAKKLYKASYAATRKNTAGFVVDRKLSGKRVQVYKNPNNNEAYVVHRGTASIKDWVTDLGMALGYEGGKRFKHSKKIQRQAEEKYGKDNITTLGHSLGGRLAEKYHRGKGKIITLNKAATPKSITRKTPANQIDIRSSNDPVSVLSNFQKHTTKPVVIKSTTWNPIKAHKVKSIGKEDREL